MNESSANSTANPKSAKSPWVWVIAAVVAAVVLINFYYGFSLLQQGSQRAATPATGEASFSRPVPAFTLTDHRGRTVGLADLQGKVWVAAFVYVRCPGPCPVITQNMTAIHKAFRDDSRVALVSFSLDPEHDTAEVLTEYAARHGAADSNWYFLTGSKEVVHDLSVNGFYSAVMVPEDAGTNGVGPIIHGTRLGVVDTQGRLVATFDAITAQGIDQTIEKVKTLLP